MKMTRLEWLADRCEMLEAEVSNHESEARMHGHVADRLRKQLEAAVEQYYAENATNQVALPVYAFNNLSTAIVADFTRSAK